MNDASLIANHDNASLKTEELYTWLSRQDLPGVTFSVRYSLGYWNQFRKSDICDNDVSVHKVGIVSGSICFHAMLVVCDKPFTFSLWKYLGGDDTSGHVFKDIRLGSLDEMSFADLLPEIVSFFGISKAIQLSLF